MKPIYAVFREKNVKKPGFDAFFHQNPVFAYSFCVRAAFTRLKVTISVTANTARPSSMTP